jgi:hypothetical protein
MTARSRAVCALTIAVALVAGVLVAGERPAAAAEVTASTPMASPDVTAALGAGDSIVSLVPARLLETRVGASERTVDRLFEGEGAVAGGSVKRLQVTGRGGVPVGALAAVLNVTAVNPSGSTFVTVFPCGDRPLASSLNAPVGGVVANEVIAKLTGSGEVCLFSLSTTDLVVDVTGYVPAGASGLASLEPARLLETRVGATERTIDRLFEGEGSVAAGVVKRLQVTGRGGVPVGALAAVLNVTAVNPGAGTFVTVFPCSDRPLASSLNAPVGGVVANEVVAKLTGSGEVCLFSLSTSDLVVDVTGYVPAPTPVVPPVDPPAAITYSFGPGWHLDPSSVMFTAAGQSRTVRLVHIGIDGQPSGRPVPAGTALIRGTPMFAVSTVSPGVYDIDGGDIVGAELLAVDIPGEEATVPLWITGLRTQVGVALLDDSQVALPPPDGADASSTGPFTVAELRDRSTIDTITGVARLAHVFSGAVPATGTIVVVGGSTSVVGRIIEPTGLPTLRRNGLTLVTIEIVGLDEAFTELDIDVDFTEAQEAGVFGTIDDRVCFNIDDADCDQVIDVGTAAPAGLVLPEALTSAPRPAALSPLGDACEASASFAAGENKAKFDRTFRYLGGIDAAVAGGTLENVELTFGLGGTVSASLEGKILATLGLGIECLLYQFDTPDIPIAPPLGAFLSAVIEPGVKLDIPIEVSAGPGVKYKATNSMTFEAVGGVRYVRGGTFVPINRSKPTTFNPEWEITPVSGGFDGLGPVAEVEFKPGLFLNALVGIRLGGKTAEWLGKIFTSDDFGRVTPFEANLGPRLDVAWENQASVVKTQKSATSALARVVLTVGLNADDLRGVMGVLGGGSFDIGLPAIEVGATFPRPVVKAKEPGTPKIEVLGKATDNVALEDVVDVEIEVKDPDPVPLIDSRFSGSVDTYRKTDAGTLVESDFFRWSTSGNTATASATIDADRCTELGDTGAAFVAAAEMTALGGLVRFPVYLGEFTIKCDQEAEFVPGDLSLSKGADRKTVTIEQKGYDETPWSIVIADGQTMPDDRSVLVVPSGGTFVKDEVPEVDFLLSCDPDADTIESVDYWLNIDGELAAAILPVALNCSPDYLEITEDRVTAGESINLDTEGIDDDRWTASGPVEPGTGFLRGAESESLEPSLLSATTRDPRTPPTIRIPWGCGYITYKGPLPADEVTAVLTTADRGADSVIIELPAVAGDSPPEGPPPPANCPPPPPPPPNPPGPPGGGGGSGPGSGTGGGSSAAANGDPHLRTFDGLRYDSQAVGEYVFVETIDGSPGPRLIARLDYTGGEPSVFSPTSVIAVGIEYGDLDIEMYTRPSPALLLSGVETVLDVGVPTEVAAGVIITRTAGGGHEVSLPEMYVTYTGIDLAVTVDPVGDFAGMLGTNNLSAADDLLIRDTASAPESWDRLSVVEAHEQGARAGVFAESWRLDDPTESPLSLPFDRFDAISQFSLDPVALAPFRAQAVALLSGVAELCSGTDAPDSYDIDFFAIELAIGTDPELLGCEYEVHGRVVTDSPSTPVIGADVVVDAPGLSPCETVTGRLGGYSCIMRLDLDELAALDITFPLEATIEVFGAGAATAGATAVHRIDDRSPLNQTRYHGVDDIVLPIDQTVTVDLSGTLEALGAPFDRATSVLGVASDATGKQVANLSIAVTPDANGDYQALVALPRTTAAVGWTWKYGIDPSDHPRSTTTGLDAGLNQARFDASYDPPVIELSGTALYNGAAPSGVNVVLTATRAGNAPFPQIFSVTPDANGAYSVPVLVPADTTSVSVSARLGDRDNPLIEASLASVVGDSNPFTFDIVQNAPVLRVFGNAQINGAAAPNTSFVVRWPGREVLSTVAFDPGDGAYSIDVDLPVGVSDATIEARIGAVRADYPVLPVTGIVDGTNLIPFDIDSAPPVVTIAGAATAGGVPIDESFRLDIATPDRSFSRNVLASVNASGEFSTQLTLPIGVTSIDVTAEIGDGVSDWDTTTFTAVNPGPNSLAFDPTFDAVGLTLSGVLAVNGVAEVGARFVRVVSFDATDAELESRDVAVDAGVDGTYSEPVQVDEAAARVEVTALIGPYPTLRPSQSFAVVPVAANPIGYSTDAQLSTLEVSGVLTSGGQFLSGPVEFRTVFDITLPDGTPSTLSVLDTAVVDGLDGTYSFERQVPELATGARVSALTRLDPADDIFVVVDPIPAGLVPVTLSGDPAIPVAIDFTGVLAQAGGPFTGTTDIRYVLREADGDLITDVTRTVTTDEFGQYRFEIDTEATVTEMSVAWLVGISGEPLAFESFDGIRPGTNTVSIANTYTPPIVEISGTATLNGQPIDDDITLEVTIVGGTEAGFTDVVSTDPATGVFTSTRTLQRGAATVDVTATTTDADNPVVTVSDVALVAGTNRIDADVTIARTNLQVSGAMRVTGTVPPGLVDVQVISKAAGQPNRTTTIQVDPADDTGIYDLQLLLPHWATSVELVAETTNQPADWPRITFTDLLTGDDPRTFDAVTDIQVLDFSGNIGMRTTAYDEPWRLSLAIVDESGTFIRWIDESIRIEPDSLGNWSIPTIEPPIVASFVRAEMNTNFSFNTREIVEVFPVTAGANDLEFNGNVDKVGLKISGTLLDDFQIATASRALRIRAYTDATNFTLHTSSTGVPDANGFFQTGLFQFPGDVIRVEIGTSHTTPNGTYQNDEIWQSFDLVDGLNRVTFDENYRPPIVTVSGNMKVDDLPVVGNRLLYVTWRQFFPNGVFPQSRNVTVEPDELGDYTVDIVGPRQSTAIEVRPQIGVLPAEWPTYSLDPVAIGPNTLSGVDADYDTTEVQLTGTAFVDGAPAPSRSASVSSYDSDGRFLGNLNVTVTPDAGTGEYTTSPLKVFSAAAEIQVIVRYGSFSQTYRSVLSPRIPITQGSTDNLRNFDIATTSITLHGSVTSAGEPQPNQPVPLVVAAYDGTTLLDDQVLDDGFFEESYVTSDASGEYSVPIYLPPGTNRVVVTPSFGDAPSLDFSPIASPGLTDAPFDIASTGGGVTIGGSLTIEGDPASVAPTMQVVSFDDGDVGDGPFGVSQLGDPTTAAVIYEDFDGTFTAAAEFDADADFLQVIVTFAEASGVSYVRNFDIRGQAPPYSLDVDIDHSASRVQLLSRSEIIDEDTAPWIDPPVEDLTDQCLYGRQPFVYDLTMRALDGQAFESGSNELAAETFVVLPNPDFFEPNRMFDIVWALPAGTVDIEFFVSTSKYYPDTDIVVAEYGYRYNLGTFSGGGVIIQDDFVTGDCYAPSD